MTSGVKFRLGRKQYPRIWVYRCKTAATLQNSVNSAIRYPVRELTPYSLKRGVRPQYSDPQDAPFHAKCSVCETDIYEYDEAVYDGYNWTCYDCASDEKGE